MSQTILIMGASSEFGDLMTQTLIGAGHTVIATIREPEGRNGRKGSGDARQGGTPSWTWT